MLRMLKRTALAVALISCVAAPGIAEEAQPQPLTPLNTTVSESELFTRLRFIEEKLHQTQDHAQIWYWGWLTVRAGSTVGNGIGVFATGDHDDKVNHGVNAVVSAIGVADSLFRPLEARYGSEKFSGMSEANRQDVIAKLRVAEDQLRRNAERAEKRYDWVEYAAGAGLALTAGTVSGVWGEAKNGIMTGVTTLAGSILSKLTEPAAPAEDWATYKRMAYGGHADLRRTDIFVSALPDGARAGVKFSW